MKLIRSLNKTTSTPLALSIGNFDGVHLGHQKIISEVKKIAVTKNLASAILTFEPHPITFFKGNLAKDFRINNLAQKLKNFAEQNIDYAIFLHFNQQTAQMKAEDFVKEILVKTLNVRHLSVGYDFIFGKNREGNFVLLEKMAPQFGFELNEIPAFYNSGKICSSSLIRQLISDGNINMANQFLGKNFTVCGVVNEGRKLASQLGFPTANLNAKPHIIKPKFGVYKTRVFVPSLGKKFLAVTNFGIKPTIAGNNSPLFESHIFNFSENLYGKKIAVEFVDFIRDEKKFNSLEELKEQIQKDCLDTVSYAGSVF